MRPVGLLFFLTFSLGWVGCGGNNGSPDDCTDPNTCIDMTPCTPMAMRCGPNNSVELCKDGSGWMPVSHCSPDQSCSGGQCSPATCSGQATRCSDDGRISMCLPTVGQYSDPVACPPNQTCIGTGCIPTVCSPNQRFCRDATTAAQCDALGDNSTITEMCTGNSTCMNGSCVDSCAAAAASKSFAGCQFYALDMNNFETDDMLENDILVANTSTTFTATVKVEVKQGQNWSTLCMAQVGPLQTHAFALTDSCDFSSENYIDRHVEDSALVAGNAYRINSDTPIVAYYYNSDDKSGAASSSGSMVLLPKATLNKKYYAVAWPMPPDPGFGGDVDRASMDVVATENNTSVTITASTNIIAGSGVQPMRAGDMQTFQMNEGDVLQLETLMVGDDLTGTYVVADKNVALFAGVECAVNPNGGSDCDHTEEQILPINSWGKNYVAPRVVGESENCSGGGQPELSCNAASWRIVAGEMGTTVTLLPPAGVNVTVTVPPGGTSPLRLDAGQFAEVTAMGTSMAAPGDFFIQGDKPIMVMQLTGSETAMVTAVPVEQYLPEYFFQAPDFFCGTLFVTRKTGTMVLYDNMPVADSLFTDAGGGYQVARFPINQQQCGVGNSQGQVVGHTITTPPGPDGRTNPAGIDVYGVDINCSYGYVGGLSIQVINDIP